MKRGVVIVVVAAGVALSAVPTLSGRLQALLFGVNTSGLTAERLKKISNLNLDIIRLDAFSWDMIEKKKGVFDFSTPDAMVALAKKNNIDILGILQYSPAWASATKYPLPEKFSSHCGLPDTTQASYDKYRAYPPINPADFGRFVYKTVQRYPSVKYWQIWNEPNNPIFWRGYPKAGQYVALLKEAYTAAKRANPETTIVFGGLSLNDQQYLEKIYAAGGKQYFDIMAMHPYNLAQAPSEYLEYELKSLKQFMENHGDGQKEIWITEIGWPTSTGGVSEETQGKYIEQTYTIAGQLGFVGAVFWHTLADCTADFQKSVDEQNYGLYRSDWSPKPGTQKYRMIVH